MLIGAGSWPFERILEANCLTPRALSNHQHKLLTHADFLFFQPLN
ncbi:hypothetical protein SynTAK9802_01135 [Synechococcus sp. TAK9802]|nr:hypothetical protein SynTAK9802_01135 [Synechococcus sp. TAK9802]